MSIAPRLAPLLLLLIVSPPLGAQVTVQPIVQSATVPILTIGGSRFRDLNKNGALDPYEDWRLSSATRAADLVGRMTTEEKVGAAVHGTAPMSGGPMASGPAYDTAAASAMFLTRHVNSVITRMSMPPAAFAEQSNTLQRIAERGRLGIPVTISSDPRSHFQAVAGASVTSNGFSQWPEALGFGALDEPGLVRRFADIVRAEYRAVGIHMALSPQADLATEPRWSRITGTFGERPDRAGALVTAYVQGMQGSPTHLTRDGVATIVKHWVGYGASVDGYDGHNYYGRYARFPGGQFAAHVKPFLGAFAAGVVGVMPTYAILDGLSIDGKPVEGVGAGFNKQILTEQLRGRYKFSGLVVSDWAITQDCTDACMTGKPRQTPFQIAMPWGVESLTKEQRFAKGMNAGIDQFGGVDDGQPLAAAMGAGLLTKARLDQAVARIMKVKFDLGLFENPYVDRAHAAQLASSTTTQREGTNAQSRALVVLENSRGATMLPPAGAKLFVSGVDAAVARARGYEVVTDAANADVAVLRIKAPYQTLHPTFFFGAFQHEGDLDFKDADSTLALLKSTSAKVPTIIVINLDRPAILTAIVPLAKTLIGEFGASDDALFDALTGKVRPVGRLPFELPRSMDAVRAQRSDVPHDSKSPLYPVGYRAPR
ncbi:MAG: glycoside hydrolase family 3 N-terminal domain-containing protein [Gemmatimonadaceae bacterium]